MSIACWACHKEFFPKKADQVCKHLCHECYDFFKGLRMEVNEDGSWNMIPYRKLSDRDQLILQEVKRRLPGYFDERLKLPPQLSFDLGFLVELIEKMEEPPLEEFPKKDKPSPQDSDTSDTSVASRPSSHE